MDELVKKLPSVGRASNSVVGLHQGYEDLATAIVIQAMKDAVGIKEDHDKTDATWEKISKEAIEWLETNENADWYSKGLSKRAAKECRENPDKVRMNLLELDKETPEDVL